MNDAPRNALVSLISEYGMSLCDDPQRCRGLLADYCAGYRSEVHSLIGALEEGVPSDLMAPQRDLPREVLLSRLTKRLRDNLAMAETAAIWAVDSWALALGLITSAECREAERKSIPATRSDKPPVQGLATMEVPLPGAATAPIVVVCPAGRGHYNTISEAIRGAQPDTQVFVRPGLYHEGIVIDKPVEIIGDGTRQRIVIESMESACVRMQTSRAKVTGMTLRGRTGLSGKKHYTVDIPQGRLFLEDCDVTSDSLACVGVHGAAADPVIRWCRIHDGTQSGVHFGSEAKGTVEECEIFGNAHSGIMISEDSNPTIRGCEIYRHRQSGVLVREEGRGVLEDCRIFDNAHAGVAISGGRNVTVRQCTINNNGHEAIWVNENGSATVENCDLSGNSAGPWRVEIGCTVWTRDNAE